MIQLIVDYVVGASRSLTQPQLRVIVHEMIYLYMETNECLIIQKGIRTFRDGVSRRCKTLKAEDRDAYFATGFLAKPRFK